MLLVAISRRTRSTLNWQHEAFLWTPLEANNKSPRFCRVLPSTCAATNFSADTTFLLAQTCTCAARRAAQPEMLAFKHQSAGRDELTRDTDRLNSLFESFLSVMHVHLVQHNHQRVATNVLRGVAAGSRGLQVTLPTHRHPLALHATTQQLPRVEASGCKVTVVMRGPLNKKKNRKLFDNCQDHVRLKS